MNGRLALAVVVALIASSGAAVAAEQGPRVEILHDMGPDATTRAGTVNTLGWMLLNEDGQPAFHQDAVFEVTHNGRTLLKTTPSSGHDYDGVDPYRVSFPGPGTFTATVTTWEAGEEVADTLEGRVLEAAGQPARIEASVPGTVEAGQSAEISYEVLGPDGPVEHADVTVHVRRSLDSFQVFRTTTHAHDGQHALSYVFDRTGSFEVTLTATPVAGEPDQDWAPVSVTRTIQVSETDPDPGVARPPSDRPLVNDRTTGSSDGPYELFGLYDPYTSVGPDGRLRLGALVLDAENGSTVDGVDMEASLMGPNDRQLFQSSDLHAADGFTYVTTSRPTVGEYSLTVHASKGDWSDTTTLSFSVLPPAAAANPVALMASPNATAEVRAGETTTIPIQVDDAAGVPLMHGEVDWRVVDAETGVTVYEGKLHTHENGTFPLTVAYPEAGGYRLEILPESLQPTPTPFTWGEKVGQAPLFDVHAEPGDDLGEATDDLAPTEADDADGVPGPGLIGALLAGLVALAARRRR